MVISNKVARPGSLGLGIGLTVGLVEFLGEPDVCELPFGVPKTRSAFHPRAQRNAFRRRDVPLALVVVSHGPIRCFRRNLMEQRLRRAQRCGEAATLGGRWVGPRLIPGSPQSLSKLLSNVKITERVRHRTRPGCRRFPYRVIGGSQRLDAA